MLGSVAVVAAAVAAAVVAVAVVALNYEISVMGFEELKKILKLTRPAGYWMEISTEPDHLKQHYDQTDVDHLISGMLGQEVLCSDTVVPSVNQNSGVQQVWQYQIVCHSPADCMGNQFGAAVVQRVLAAELLVMLNL